MANATETTSAGRGATPGTSPGSMSDPTTRLRMPPEAQHAEAGNLDLDDQQGDAEQDQQEARGAHGHELKREEGEQQAEPPDDARQNRARVPQLDRQAERAEHEQQRRHLRVRDGAQDALAPGHLHLDDAGVGGPDGHGAAVEARDGRAIQLLEQVTDVGRNQVDERRRRGQGLAIGERAAVEHGLGRKGDVAPAAFGERPGPRRQIRRDLLRHGLVRLGVRRASAGRHGMGGAHVGARRHRRDVGGQHQDEARRRGARPGRSDQNRDGRAGRDHAADDGLRGVHQPAWRPEREDEQRGPLGIRAVDGRHHELGRHRVDDAVDFRRIDQRRCRIGRSRGQRAGRGGQHDANRHQPSHDDAQRIPERQATSRADRVNRSDVHYRNRSCLSMHSLCAISGTAGMQLCYARGI